MTNWNENEYRERLLAMITAHCISLIAISPAICLRHSVSRILRFQSNAVKPNPALGLNYLVQIDNDGKLRWAKTGDLIDTTAGNWKDAGGGQGIVPLSHPEKTLQRRTSFDPVASPNSSNSSVSESGPEAQMNYYLGPRPAGSRIKT